MEIYLLLGPKSAGLKDIDLFCRAFEKTGVQLKKIMANDIDVMCCNDNSLFINGSRAPIPDAVISAYFGDINSHNLYVTGEFESMGILCINSARCLVEARDKLTGLLKIKASLLEVRIPKTLLYSKGLSPELVKSFIGFPLVAKIIHGSRGAGVEIVPDTESLDKIVRTMADTYSDGVLLQEYIKSSRGRDIRFIMCGGKYITSFVRSNSHGFISNIAAGGNIEFFQPENKLIEQAENIAELLDINLGSVDFLFGGDGEYYFCEANAMPGLKYTEYYTKAGFKNPMETIAENIKAQVCKRNQK
ncbi:hypothetical protein MUJ63_01425 [Lachnospiraceae bacterium NSJ-143]|nr:hypothetical protein [Lachnospiraceae bacterium NSJ-143]